MAHSFTRLHPRNPRTIWRWHAVGLLFIVAAFVASHIILFTALKQSEDNTIAINLSGQQGVLSQRISHLATRLMQHSANQDKWASELSEAATHLERAHHALIQGGGSGLDRPLPPELRPYYFQSDQGPSLDQRITSLVNKARTFSKSYTDTQSKEALGTDILAGSDAILRYLDRAVSAHKSYALAHINQAKALSRLTLAAALFMLLALVIFIFWPAYRAVKYALDTHEKSLLALETENKDLKHFSHLASHDLKAPLNGMKNLVEWIEEDVEPALTPDIRHNFDLLKSRILRMNTLLADILYHARIGQNQEPETQVDIRAVVESATHGIAKPETYDIVMATSLPVITAPEIHIQKIFNVLISNAVKHHDTQTGTLTISHHIDGTLDIFTFTDDGPGLEHKYHDYIFAMFNRLKSRDEVEGSGIGLPIARKTAELLGGTLTLASEGDGKGSAFTLRLPRNSV